MRMREGLLYASWVVFLCTTWVGYEVDVERHAGTEVYRRERLVPVWEAIPAGERPGRLWHTWLPRDTDGQKQITQHFLFGLETREHTEFRRVVGPCIKPPAVH
jgi:hypothetical protein